MRLVISIVGFGNIGKYVSGLLLAHRDFGCTINIVDVDPDVYGGVLDLQHAAELMPEHDIAYNSTELFNQSDFIFHCAGASVPRGESRLKTCKESIAITEAVFKDFHPEKAPKIVVIANPVDVIAYATQKITGLPPSHVVGTGTFLDSIRMNHVVKKTHAGITDVNAVLLGEHGSSVFLSQQLSTANGQSFHACFSKDSAEEMLKAVKAAAEEIKKTQSATIYGVSFCAVKIFEALLGENTTQYPVSTLPPADLAQALGSGSLYLSLYSDLSTAGANPVKDYVPDETERALLRKSADLIAQSIPAKYR